MRSNDTAQTLKPTNGAPHDSESLDGCEGIGWDLSWGFRLNVGHDDAEDPTSPLTIGACFSDSDQARGIVVRKTSPEQLEEFARLLLSIAAKHRARTTPAVAYADRCPDSAPHLWVGRDGRPATGDDTDRCDACSARRSTVTRPSASEGPGADPFPASRLIERAASAGYRLTPVGRQVLAFPSQAALDRVNEALDQGVRFDQIATSDWDGELLFEQVDMDSAPNPSEQSGGER